MSNAPGTSCRAASSLILLVAALACFTLACGGPPRESDQHTTTEKKERGGLLSNKTGGTTKGIAGTQENLERQETHFRRERPQLPAAADSPAFHRLRPELLGLIASADELYSHSHDRCETWLEQQVVEMQSYCWAIVSPVVAVEAANHVLRELERTSATRMAENVVEWDRKLGGRMPRLYELLAAYSSDPESVRRYHHEPQTLAAVLSLAIEEKRKVPEALERDDPVAAWLHVVHADMLANWIQFVLADYEHEVHNKTRPGRP